MYILVQKVIKATTRKKGTWDDLIEFEMDCEMAQVVSLFHESVIRKYRIIKQ